jgi:glycine betaine/choline ABC-type transport system substrate-binding protein
MEVYPGSENKMYSLGWVTKAPYTWEQVEAMSVDQLLDVEFDDGYGSECPIQLKAWTKSNVYFSYEYDGSDFILTVPRKPPTKKEQHKTYRYFWRK